MGEVPVMILNDQVIAGLIGNPEYQAVFPLFKVLNSQYRVPSGCRCNSGQRKRAAIEKAKSYILSLPGTQKAQLKNMLGAKAVRISGIQNGRPVVVTIQ